MYQVVSPEQAAYVIEDMERNGIDHTWDQAELDRFSSHVKQGGSLFVWQIGSSTDLFKSYNTLYNMSLPSESVVYRYARDPKEIPGMGDLSPIDSILGY